MFSPGRLETSFGRKTREGGGLVTSLSTFHVANVCLVLKEPRFIPSTVKVYTEMGNTFIPFNVTS